MQGMIAHHAQAIYMSRLAAAHGANPRVLKFANKIDQSQHAEIRLMQDWLHREQPVGARHVVVAHDADAGHAHGRAAQGRSTRRRAPTSIEQFLTLMIQHHNGALKMVADLLAAPLAAQDVDVSVFANDVADRADRRDRHDAPDVGNLEPLRPLPELRSDGKCSQDLRLAATLAPSPRRRRCTRRRIRPATIRETD